MSCWQMGADQLQSLVQVQWHLYRNIYRQSYFPWLVKWVNICEISSRHKGDDVRIQVLRHVILCHRVNTSWLFEKLCCLHLQGQDSGRFILSQHDPSQCQQTPTAHHSVTSLFIMNPVHPDGHHTTCSSRNLHTLQQKVPPTSSEQILLLKWPALTLS